MITRIISLLAFLILSPIIGILLDGFDRKICARMQRRKGPSILQPFYDLRKLFSKQNLSVNNVQMMLTLSYLVFLMVAGGLLYSGNDILMCLFILSLADMFLVVASSSDSSPYANLGADREMLQIMAFEPLTLLIAVGFYLATGSFKVHEIIQAPVSAVIFLPGMLIGFIFTATIKFRKSPFDLATSHHAHQEMVKGLTTEMSGTTLAVMEIAEYYEMILILGIFGLFIVNSSSWISWPIAVVVCLVIYFLEILWDNTSGRLNWQKMLAGSWVVTLIAGGINLLILMLVR